MRVKPSVMAPLGQMREIHTERSSPKTSLPAMAAPDRLSSRFTYWQNCPSIGLDMYDDGPCGGSGGYAVGR